MHAPHKQPHTSAVAHARAKRTAESKRGRILAAIRAAGRDGLTTEEIEQATGIKHQSCSPRVGELAREGLIRLAGRQRATATGSPAEVYVGVERPASGAVQMRLGVG